MLRTVERSDLVTWQRDLLAAAEDAAKTANWDRKTLEQYRDPVRR